MTALYESGPGGAGLKQNTTFSYPNPFGITLDCSGNAGGVCFAFESTLNGVVTLQIFDLSGFRIREIVYANPATDDGVPDRIHWDGTTEGGYHVANGVYIWRIQVKASAGFTEIMRGLCFKFSYPPSTSGS